MPGETAYSRPRRGGRSGVSAVRLQGTCQGKEGRHDLVVLSERFGLVLGSCLICRFLRLDNLLLTHLERHSLPETKTIPLERMDELFATDVRPWNAHRIAMEHIKDNMHVAETGNLSTSDMRLNHDGCVERDV
ncbi:hypothetical protein BDZ89DRAFT_392398 [Hymenopellis radicata]|nr:hypothetical protein BDZ89DRAFT_392398 [Hymenopellis radicata]